MRFSNENAKLGASQLSADGVEFIYIPQTPIADITTETAWLYSAIAKFLLIETYSVYDLISEIPVEGNESRKNVSTIKKLLENIENTKCDKRSFEGCVIKLAEYIGYDRSHSEIV